MTNDLVKKLDAFFEKYGYFNPWVANPQEVSDLLKDCRAHIIELEAGLEPIRARLADRKIFEEALYGDTPTSDEKEIYVRLGDLRTAVRPLNPKEPT